jgi:oxygen-dependent protoporphyrinogen oxidase
MTDSSHNAADSNHNVVVIGAGISGLVCAHRLKSLGADVVLIEKAQRAGGVIQSDRIGDYLVERGPNSSRGTRELMDLIEDLGIAGDLVEGDPKAPSFIYFGGALHRVPMGPAGLIMTDVLTPGAKLRLLTEPFRRARKSAEEESVDSFFARRLGPQLARKVVAAFVSGIYAGDSSSLSIQAAFPGLAALERDHGGIIKGAFKELGKARSSGAGASGPAAKTSQQTGEGARAGKRKRPPRLASFREGMSFLPQRLAASLGEDFIPGCDDVRVEIPAANLGDSAGRLETAPSHEALANFRVNYSRAGRPESINCKSLVVGTPAWVASELTTPLSEELSELLGEVPYPPLAIVCISYDEAAVRAPVTGFGFLAVPGEGLAIMGCLFSSSLFPDRAPEGKVLFTTFVGGALNPSLARLADSELVALVHDDLRRVLRITGDPHPVAITRYERSIPQYNIGHAARILRIEELVSHIPGLTLVGNYLHGVSTGDCIKEGDRSARQIYRDSQDSGPQ